MTRQSLKAISVCSAQRHVITAALQTAVRTHAPLYIEATANQVNHQGGYSGMRPADFRALVQAIAGDLPGRPPIRLGGDHLGPAPWRHTPAVRAMDQAVVMVREYVQAGFGKLHLDTATPLADDADLPLPPAIVATRTATLCAAAEKAFLETFGSRVPAPVYVIGQDVPPAGGRTAQQPTQAVTAPADFQECIFETRRAFLRRGLENAWSRVVAVVVNTGAEFTHTQISPYNHDAMRPLIGAAVDYPELVFEGHSTDYQSPESLAQMAADGVHILKVGPCLTFALREVLLALSHIETYLITPAQQSGLFEVLDAAMRQEPRHWQNYYTGDAQELLTARRFSYLDRCRYYWGYPAVQQALTRLLSNLGRQSIPATLISQYLPDALPLIPVGRLTTHPEELCLYRIRRLLDAYVAAIESIPASVM